MRDSIFTQRHKIKIWRDLWIILAEEELKLGLTRITQEAIDSMKRNRDDIDFELAADYEKRLRHDVMAHIHAYETVAPEAKGIIHLGATSQYIVDNADMIIFRQGFEIIVSQLEKLITLLKNLPIDSTEMKWAITYDIDNIKKVSKNLKTLGCKGTTGTQASFLSLFDGDHDKCEQLDINICARIGFLPIVVSGQTYPRILDAQISSALALVIPTVREVSRALESRELINRDVLSQMFDLGNYGISIMSNPYQTASEQWFERTLDDSSNRRLSMPNMFMTVNDMVCSLISDL
jgi:adenylosuccinate lyase